MASMDKSDQSFDSLCRTCMIQIEPYSSDSNNEPLHQWQYIFNKIEGCGDLLIAELLCTTIPQMEEVQLSDELPKKICCNCLHQLLSVYRFQKMCVQTDQKMRELLQKKTTWLNISAVDLAIEGDIIKGEDSYQLTSSHCNTFRNLHHVSINEKLFDTVEQTIKPKAVHSNGADHLQNIDNLYMEYCKDSQGEFIKNGLLIQEELGTGDQIINPSEIHPNFSEHFRKIDQSLEHCKDSKDEFVKNETVEDDAPNFGYNDGDRMHSTISVKHEIFSIETEVLNTNMRSSKTSCHICNESFKDDDYLEKHMRRHKTDAEEIQKQVPRGMKAIIKKNSHICEFCGKKWNTRFSLTRHLRIHHFKSITKTKQTSKQCFSSSTTLRSHVQHKHTGELPYSCAKCGKSFSTKRNLDVHRLIDNEDRPYQCPHCPLKYGSEQSMSRHKEIHEGNKLQPCDICGKSIRKLYLARHKRIHTNANKCNICEKRFTAPSYLRVHKRTHTGEKPHKCKYCGKSFSQLNGLNSHLRRHLGGNIYRCEFCPLTFALALERSLHRYTHKDEDPERRERNLTALREEEAKMTANKHEEKPSRHNCGICGKSFSIKSLLKKHELRHSNERPYKCDFCGMRFKRSHNQRYHMRTHASEKSVYRCKFCPLAFPLASELSLHSNTHGNEDPETRERNMEALKEEETNLKLTTSTEETTQQLQIKATEYKYKKGMDRKNEICDICGKSFRYKQRLRVHIQAHSNEKRYKCDFCEKRFTQIANARIHMRTHTGEKPYKCKYCEKAFGQSHTLYKHFRIHLGDNVYRCEFCPLAFSLASERRLHLKTHENEDSETREQNMKALREEESKLMQQIKQEEKPARHNCGICGRCFSIKSLLKKHELRHSNERPYKCDFCGMRFKRSHNQRNHMRTHASEKNVYRCKFCPLAFPLASELGLHSNTHVNEDPETRERNMKALKKEETKLKLTTSTEETTQQLQIKATEYRYKGMDRKKEICDICGKSFRYKQRLRVHIQAHGKEKRYKCDFCEKRFTQIANARIHMRTHTGEKPYKCKYCEKAYGQSHTLYKHLRKHLGDNVYRCEFCPLAFSLASERRLHLKTHENEDSETREQNMKALREEESTLMQQIKFYYTFRKIIT
ncbi:zinc finger protein 493-like isoform X2 [Eurosta solidaginis]|uniref:zinc finger protein 493-like isoform X2 n=1 Tax=Eurosta solidaginis TaxID=178769 RepID=UPI0035316029